MDIIIKIDTDNTMRDLLKYKTDKSKKSKIFDIDMSFIAKSIINFKARPLTPIEVEKKLFFDGLHKLRDLNIEQKT